MVRGGEGKGTRVERGGSTLAGKGKDLMERNTLPKKGGIKQEGGSSN